MTTINPILSFDGKPSPDNPRTPTLCVANASLTPRSGVLTTSHKYVPERTTSPPISPQNQTQTQSIYSHITIQYASLIKQLITQMVFVKFYQRVIEQTNQTLEFMTCRSSIKEPDHCIDRQKDYHNIFQKIVTEHITNHLPEIWDNIFAEHNIDIVFRYLVDLVNHLSEYSTNTTTTDPKYIYSQQTIRKHFLTNSSRVVYLPETYAQYTHHMRQPHHHHRAPSYTNYQCIEHEKQIRNSILVDVFEYIFQNTLDKNTHQPTVYPRHYYVYLEHYARRLKQHDGTCIFDKHGNLEITESLLRQVRSEARTKDLEDYPEMVYHRRIMHKYQQAPIPTTYYEIYTIWLLDIWLSETRETRET
jgi:hypothetical protein